MNINLFAGLFFWGMVVRSLSQLITVSVTLTQGLLTWISYGLWVSAGVMAVYAGVRHLRPGKHDRVNTEAGHEE
ncbi:hypothetical protein [Superficieibacter sp. 1612_C1]|jgi:ABC-type nickel/cobalt efflux system permease component RcnA|uniref:hypothetical protein n=1 Tax=Superficieibacter sp. 1612_C1 TaxID=2780382 RepID=UPI0018844B65|nr:hypothetical protein [Superficieibacter sp. 1612_C1]